MPSRRFGRSIGVNPIPMKVCNYSCVYCQLGRTKNLQIERKKYFETKDVIDSLYERISANGGIDYITFMGDGEPTLAANLGEMVSELKGLWDGKTALITNGSLLFKTDVKKDALLFDVVSPTVAAGDEKKFRRIHRPHGKITYDLYLKGLMQFSEEYGGICGPK